MRNKLIILIEVLIVDSLLFWIFFLMSGHKEGFLTLNINPLLLVTVFVALFYGTTTGVISAIIGAFFYLLAYLLLGKDIYFIFVEYSIYKFFLMFFLFGFLFGKIRDSIDLEMRAKEERAKSAENRQRELEENFEQLMRAHEILKLERYDGEKSMLSLITILTSLDKHNYEKIITDLDKIFHTALYVESVSLYTLDESKFKLRIRTGEKYCENELNRSDFNTIEKGEVYFNESGGENLPIMWSGVYFDETLMGVICIESMKFKHITQQQSEIFKMIMKWFNRIITRELKALARYRERVYYGDSNILKYGAYQLFKNEVYIQDRKYNSRSFEMIYGGVKLETLNTLSHRALHISLVDYIAYDESKNLLYLLVCNVSEDVKEIERLVESEVKNLVEEGEHVEAVHDKMTFPFHLFDEGVL